MLKIITIKKKRIIILEALAMLRKDHEKVKLNKRFVNENQTQYNNRVHKNKAILNDKFDNITSSLLKKTFIKDKSRFNNLISHMDEQFHSSQYSVSNKDSEFVMYKNYSKEDRTNLKLFKEEIERKTDDFELVFP